MARQATGRRAERAVLAVLPRAVNAHIAAADADADLTVNGQPLEVKWVGEGTLRDVRAMLERGGSQPDVLAGRRLSPGARELLSRAGIGWVDETGAAEIAVGSLVVSRTGRSPKPERTPKRWTPAVMAVAEALLCGTKPTVAATQGATGLSTGSCTNALRFLTDMGLLEAASARGRESGRRISDLDRLLDAYAAAVEAAPATVSLQVGGHGRDATAVLIDAGERWDQANLEWAATGAAAASVIAPFLTSVSSVEAYIEADTIAALQAAAADAGLRPIEGGRLTLRPFPTIAVRRLSALADGLRVAPWPRVYADLRTSGVRGEEAAEHLSEVIRGG